jgi:F-type H+-transporting ATPase subunit b
MLSRHVFASGMLAVDVLTAAPVMAAEADAPKSGLPQLDMSLYPAQLFWLAVFFGLLYVLMRYVALPAVHRTQEHRRATIASALMAARRANDDAQRVMAEVEQSLAEARAKARATVDAIRLETTNDAAERLAEQQRGLMRRLRDTESKIVTARVAAMKNVNTAAKELSIVIAQRVSGLKAQGGRS